MKMIVPLLLGLIFLNSTVIRSQNAPVTTAGAFVSNEAAVIIPVTTADFTNIGSCNLKLTYNPALVTATAVTNGPLLGGNLASNLNIPGLITLGWFAFPAVTLPANTVIFNISFSKVAPGTSALTWLDDGYSCIYYDGNSNPLNDLPTSTYYKDGSVTFQSTDAPLTWVPDITACPGTSVEIPVKVSAFNQIGALSLTLQYNSSVLTYLSFTNNSGFPGLQVNAANPGTIIAGGFSTVPPGITLADSAVLFTLNFAFLGGSTELAWYDDGSSCEYAGAPPLLPTLNDSPQGSYYFDGSVTELLHPAPAGPISGPPGGIVCQGQTGVTFSVPFIPNATGYHWEVPVGGTIASGVNSNSISVNFSSSSLSGVVSVYGTNSCASGDTAFMTITMDNYPGNAAAVNGSQLVCQGQNQVNYSVDPIPNALVYNWTIPAGAIITGGGNTNNITLSYGNSAESGDVLVYGSNDCGNGAASVPLAVTVNSMPEIITQPVSPGEITAGAGSATFTVAASGTGLTYHWQEFVSSWVDLSEVGVYNSVFTNTLMIINPPFAMNGNHYRCVVTGTCTPSAISDGIATLTVTMPVGMEQGPGSKFGFVTYPNPFSDYLAISFYQPGKCFLIVKIYNILGQEIESLSENLESEGIHKLEFTTANLPSGIYNLSLMIKTENKIMMSTGKMVCNHY